MVFHLVGNFEVTAAGKQHQRLNLTFFGASFKQVRNFTAFDDFHLFFDRVGRSSFTGFRTLTSGAHTRNVEEVHVLNNLTPVVVQAVRQNRKNEFQHSRLHRFEVFSTVAAAGVVFQNHPAGTIFELEV